MLGEGEIDNANVTNVTADMNITKNKFVKGLNTLFPGQSNETLNTYESIIQINHEITNTSNDEKKLANLNPIEMC